jgi:hypothetical protein
VFRVVRGDREMMDHGVLTNFVCRHFTGLGVSRVAPSRNWRSAACIMVS